MAEAAGAVAVAIGKNLLNDRRENGTTFGEALMLFGCQCESVLRSIFCALSVGEVEAVVWLGDSSCVTVDRNAIGTCGDRYRCEQSKREDR